jgi:hypothetical protein
MSGGNLLIIVWLIIWSAFGLYLAKAPLWFIAIGWAFMLWGTAKSAYIRSAVPDLPAPQWKGQVARPIKPTFSKAEVTLSSVWDVLIGGLLFLFGTGLLLTNDCVQMYRDGDVFGCVFDGFFVVIGGFFLFSYWREQRLEDHLESRGVLVTGAVTGRVHRGKSGTYITYEFSTATGERLDGEFPDNRQGLEEGNEVLIVYDPDDPRKHGVPEAFRFYRLDTLLLR